jgi:hypothetical protein
MNKSYGRLLDRRAVATEQGGAVRYVVAHGENVVGEVCCVEELFEAAVKFEGRPMVAVNDYLYPLTPQEFEAGKAAYLSES